MVERNCKKCFHYKACKEVASHSGYGDINYTEIQCKHFIPTADVVEVKHGEWRHECLECSACKRNISEICDADSYLTSDIEHELLYCPFCGAKMDGEMRGT